ncbi:peroxiredoxin [Streptomyces sp. ST2-7A]|uniref:peroxiredoxin n=1 Tax=Streptomyces sp. ST2-7A TaxID=2907214 RepID=UPI001F235F65|nr:peroxiredoxin [Streptomyces sp. ST2-7A]MCE7081355.1 peroxiredoxin [Streptomyces sp. ST2-7A]
MEITPGTKAPDFALRNQHGETVRLSDFRAGSAGPGDAGRNVVLLFFPFAFTGICTGELCEVRDRLPDFVNDDTQLLAVSADSPFALRVFAEQEGLEYHLLSDFWPHGEVSRAYGVFNEDRGCPLRGTFVIDREGVVRWSVINGMPDARDLDAYIAALDALRDEV